MLKVSLFKHLKEEHHLIHSPFRGSTAQPEKTAVSSVSSFFPLQYSPWQHVYMTNFMVARCGYFTLTYQLKLIFGMSLLLNSHTAEALCRST